MGVGETGQIIGETGVGERGVGEMEVIYDKYSKYHYKLYVIISCHRNQTSYQT